MKFKSYLNWSLFSAMMLAAMSGCTEEEFAQQDNNIPKGNGIVFGANASYAGDPQSRTEYGEYVTDDSGKKLSQEIKWLDTDEVDIYSPESPSLKKVKYGIQNVNENQAYLLALGEGLQWDRTSSTQDFYAIYPAIESMKNETVRNTVSFENGVLKGYIPVNQQHTITKSGNVWTAKPNMDYMYMAAVQKGYPVPAANVEDDGVSLHFVPLTTTLELTIEGPTEAPIASINVFANNGENIAGYFSCDLTQANTSTTEGTELTCNYESSATVRNMITISGYYDDNGTQRPLELAAGESITFNVFLLPHANLENISVRVAGFNTASKTLALSGVTLHPHQKTCVKVKAPEISSGEVNTWITGMNDNVLVSQLSIPGTANSFSASYTGANPDWYQAQTASIEKQWNAGIRCFELRGPNSSTTDLADAPLQCNRTNIGKTFGAAVEEIWKLLQDNPGEFAIIMPAFESNDGRGTNVTDYATDLNNFFDKHPQYKYVTYGSKLTVGEARGSLMFIARITSEEDGNMTLDMPKQGVFVNEWGSLKDNWARRGYPVPNWAKNDSYSSSMEYRMLNGNTYSNFVPTNLPEKEDVDYIHDTQRADDSNGEAYIQDWARVVPADKNYKLYSYYYGGSHTQYVYWKESKTEKQNDIWDTFLKSIEANSKVGNTTFYINCLDGYYVDDQIPLSINPYIQDRNENGHSYTNGGVAGNIQAFASDINNWFYQQILNYGEDNIYGPMNIVILDRVYESESGGDSYLPSVIINNNYRFPLLTSDGSTTQYENGSDASYTSGGSVIK